MNDIARDIMMLAGNYSSVSFKSPTSQGRQRQYFAEQTQANAALYGELADNVYDTAIQGLDPQKDWYEFTPVQIRTASASISTTGEVMPDDWQRIHIIQPSGITYISQGAYLFYANSWWIVYKSNNMSTGLGQAIVRRCNAVVNVYDYYGNVVPIPISYAKMGTLSNAAHSTENTIEAKNYISCVCQYNEHTSGFSENTRIILGNTAYAMRGVNNFTREFTNEDSVRLISFTIELDRPLPTDDMENKVADGLSLEWQLNVTANPTMNVNGTQQLAAQARRNGNTPTKACTYSYVSSKKSVATVSATGLITAHSTGTADITVSLRENPKVKQTVTIEVTAARTYVGFTLMPKAEIETLESTDVTAAFFENGAKTVQSVSFEFTGENGSFGTENKGNNRYTLTAYAAGKVLITAKYGAYSATTEVLMT